MLAGWLVVPQFLVPVAREAKRAMAWTSKAQGVASWELRQPLGDGKPVRLVGLDPRLDRLGKRLGKPGRVLARAGARAQFMPTLTWQD